MDTEIKVTLITEFGRKPIRATTGAAGYDLFAAEGKIIMPWRRECIKTDVAFQISPGTFGRIISRSGLSARRSVDVVSGVIDSDFRGNTQVIRKILRGRTDGYIHLLIETFGYKY